MLELIFGTAFAIALRMLMGHLAIKFTVLKSWLTWFDWLAIIVAVITAAVLVLHLIRAIVRLARENKQGRERYHDRSFGVVGVFCGTTDRVRVRGSIRARVAVVYGDLYRVRGVAGNTDRD